MRHRRFLFLRTILVVVTLAVTACTQPPQSGPCKDYVDCCTRLDAGGCSESTFGAMGTCWTTTQAAADACTTRCKASNESYQSNDLAADAGCTFQ